MSEILGNIFIWVFSINSEIGLLLALVKYVVLPFYSKLYFLYFLEAKNLLIFVYLFCPKNGSIDFTKAFITQEWLVVESCPTPRWIAFLMLYRLVYNIRSHFNELILAWSACETCGISFLYEDKNIGRFSYLHYGTFKAGESIWKGLIIKAL